MRTYPHGYVYSMSITGPPPESVTGPPQTETEAFVSSIKRRLRELPGRIKSGVLALPFLTRSLLFIFLGIFVGQILFGASSYLHLLCLSPHFVLREYRLTRIFTSVWFHNGFVHLIVDMLFFIPTASRLEHSIGTVQLGHTVLLLIVLVGTLHTILTWLIATFYMPEEHFHCSLGISGVLFGLSVIEETATTVASFNVGGVNVSSFWVPWVLLAGYYALMPGVAPVLHLSGILVGYAHVYNGLSWVLLDKLTVEAIEGHRYMARFVNYQTFVVMFYRRGLLPGVKQPDDSLATPTPLVWGKDFFAPPVKPVAPEMPAALAGLPPPSGGSSAATTPPLHWSQSDRLVKSTYALEGAAALELGVQAPPRQDLQVQGGGGMGSAERAQPGLTDWASAPLPRSLATPLGLDTHNTQMAGIASVRSQMQQSAGSSRSMFEAYSAQMPAAATSPAIQAASNVPRKLLDQLPSAALAASIHASVAKSKHHIPEM